ncbi:unnamed protein product, partial [Symbiodinium sp. CCMP2592]
MADDPRFVTTLKTGNILKVHVAAAVAEETVWPAQGRKKVFGLMDDLPHLGPYDLYRL